MSDLVKQGPCLPLMLSQILMLEWFFSQILMLEWFCVKLLSKILMLEWFCIKWHQVELCLLFLLELLGSLNFCQMFRDFFILKSKQQFFFFFINLKKPGTNLVNNFLSRRHENFYYSLIKAGRTWKGFTQ